MTKDKEPIDFFDAEGNRMTFDASAPLVMDWQRGSVPVGGDGCSAMSKATMKTVIEMAESCGIPEFENYESQAENIMRFAKLVAALAAEREREECAKLVDFILKEGGGTWGDAIRARGNA